MSYLNSVTELYSAITPTDTLTYCFLSYFESKILINIESLESLGEHRNPKARCHGHLCQAGKHIVHIYDKNTKIIVFSRTNRPTTLKLVMWHCVREYYQDCSNYDPWLTLTFYAKVKLDHVGFCMGKSEIYLLINFGNY